MVMTCPPDLRLREIGFRKFRPSKQLQSYVQCFWAIDRKDKPHSPIVHRLASDGGIGIVINSGSPFYRLSCGKSYCFGGRSIIIGATENSALMSFDEDIHAVGVRFHPGKSYPFIQIPAYELTNHVVPSHDIGLQVFDDKPELFTNSDNLEQRIKILDNLLTSRLVEFNLKEERVSRSVALIQKYNGLIKLDDVASKTGMSRRSFERRFRFHVGLSPKVFSRIIRIQTVRHYIRSGTPQSLTSLAHDTGFYDQAHFIREFRAIMDMTPGQYLMEKRGDVSHLYNA